MVCSQDWGVVGAAQACLQLCDGVCLEAAVPECQAHKAWHDQHQSLQPACFTTMLCVTDCMHRMIRSGEV